MLLLVITISNIKYCFLKLCIHICNFFLNVDYQFEENSFSNNFETGTFNDFCIHIMCL